MTNTLLFKILNKFNIKIKNWYVYSVILDIIGNGGFKDIFPIYQVHEKHQKKRLLHNIMIVASLRQTLKHISITHSKITFIRVKCSLYWVIPEVGLEGLV